MLYLSKPVRTTYHSRPPCLVAVAVTLTCLSACVEVLPIVATFDVAPELAHVLKNMGNFDIEDSILLGVTPGTVMDDLHGLSGCWGGLLRGGSGRASPVLVVVYKFDPSDASFTRWTTVAMPDGAAPFGIVAVTTERGHYEIRDDAHIVMYIEQSTIQDNLGLWQPPEPPADLVFPDRIALVTLSGDRMLLYIDIDVPEEATEAERLVFARFDCP